MMALSLGGITSQTRPGVTASRRKEEIITTCMEETEVTLGIATIEEKAKLIRHGIDQLLQIYGLSKES